MTCEGSHPVPKPHVPWWEWACPVCSPSLYDDMTVRGSEPDARIECPMCLNTSIYREGKFKNHWDDSPSLRCRGSGLCRDMAYAVVEATVRRDTVATMLDRFVVRKGVRPLPKPLRGTSQPISENIRTIICKLVQHRRAAGITSVSLVETLGVRPNTFSQWENVARPCHLGSLFQWAQELGYLLILQGPDGETYSSGPEAIVKGLQHLRHNANLTLDQVESKIGLPKSRVGAWERLQREPYVNDLDFLASLLGSTLSLVREPILEAAA